MRCLARSLDCSNVGIGARRGIEYARCLCTLVAQQDWKQADSHGSWSRLSHSSGGARLRRGLSIGFRLTLWYVAVFAVAQLVFGASMYLILRQSLYSITDDALHDQIDDLTHFLEAQKKNVTVAKLQ